MNKNPQRKMYAGIIYPSLSIIPLMIFLFAPISFFPNRSYLAYYPISGIVLSLITIGYFIHKDLTKTEEFLRVITVVCLIIYIGLAISAISYL